MTLPDALPQVLVRGEATLLVDPEIAELGVTVTTRARDRQSALERCRARQDDVTAVVSAAGDAVERVETTGVSIHREGRGAREDGDPAASLHTRVTLGRLDAVGDLVVALGRLDDVAVSGPSWRLRPESEAYEQARLGAVRDAVGRARSYAAAVGSELTALLEIRDAGLSGGDFRVAETMSAMGTFVGGEFGLELMPARQEVHGSVEIRFTMSTPGREVLRG